MAPLEGDVRFEISLAYPKQLGYDISRVHCTLTHRSSGKVVEVDLTVEGSSASGFVRGLRIGTWDLLAELFEDGEVVGAGTAPVEISVGAATTVMLPIALSTVGAAIDALEPFGDFLPGDYIGWAEPVQVQAGERTVELVIEWDPMPEASLYQSRRRSVRPYDCGLRRPSSAVPGEEVGDRLSLTITNNGAADAIAYRIGVGETSQTRVMMSRTSSWTSWEEA